MIVQFNAFYWKRVFTTFFYVPIYIHIRIPACLLGNSLEWVTL